jgi:hypothetical protein
MCVVASVVVMGLPKLSVSACIDGKRPTHITPTISSIKDIDGKTHRMDDGKHRASTVLFIAHDCPISNGYAPEINRLIDRYSKKGVQFFIVYTEADLTAGQARSHAREYGFKCTLAMDSRHELAKRAHVTVTPEAVVVNSKGKQAYRGRINDLYVALGTRRYEATRHDLRLALDAVISGKAVSVPTTRAVGCFIPSTN